MKGLADVERLDAAGRAALPALTETRLGEWIVRRSGGATKRVNSASPARPGALLGDVLGRVELAYAEHGLSCRFRLTPLADQSVEAALADAGYVAIDQSITMIMRPQPVPADAAITLAPLADAAWHAASQQLQQRSDTATGIQKQLLAAMPGPCGFASIVTAGATLASAYASIGSGVAQISDVVVAPQARRQGLGAAIVRSLTGWAARQGCRETMLQVLESNVTAHTLYRRLGFVDAYRYHYRVRQ